MTLRCAVRECKQIMEGMIFAAGLGTRLRPLTNDRPKAMVTLAGKPLLEHVIVKMRNAGIGRIVVNVHHFADQIEDFLRNRPELARDVVVSDERDCLLDTGGGLWKAADLFTPGEAVLIHNVDILADIDLQAVMRFHQQYRNFATLVVRPAVPGRGLRFDADGVLKGWENSLTGEQKVVDEGFRDARSYSFCGVHIVSPEFLQHFVHRGALSIIDEYLAQAKSHALRMYLHKGDFMDLGTPEAIAEAEERMRG